MNKYKITITDANSETRHQIIEYGAWPNFIAGKYIMPDGWIGFVKKIEEVPRDSACRIYKGAYVIDFLQKTCSLYVRCAIYN